MSTARLIIDPPASGIWNMAVDEALLQSAAERGITTLRLYQWEVPTLSLGYFQSAADREQHAASRDCLLVRRASGGGAIVHDRELTYSLTVPLSDSRLSSATDLYDAVHLSLVECFAEFGIRTSFYGKEEYNSQTPTSDGEPFLCFQRRACGDIVSGNVKVVGSAQRRRRGAVLQHGSILLSRSDSAPELQGLREVAGRPMPAAAIAERWPRLLAQPCGVVWKADTLTGQESNAAIAAADRFAGTDYVRKR